MYASTLAHSQARAQRRRRPLLVGHLGEVGGEGRPLGVDQRPRDEVWCWSPGGESTGRLDAPDSWVCQVPGLMEAGFSRLDVLPRDVLGRV